MLNKLFKELAAQNVHAYFLNYETVEACVGVSDYLGFGDSHHMTSDNQEVLFVICCRLSNPLISEPWPIVIKEKHIRPIKPYATNLLSLL